MTTQSSQPESGEGLKAPVASVAIPSKGRLRKDVIELLSQAGYDATKQNPYLTFVEMRPRDAAEWLMAGRLDAAFSSTDIGLESGIDQFPTTPLGFAKSDLVVACRSDASFQSPADLAGTKIATHLPNWTSKWFGSQGIDVTVVAMGGSLEGVCAEGYADAIVDLRATGRSLREYSLRALFEAEKCQATFVRGTSENEILNELVSRMEAVLAAKNKLYVRLHLQESQIPALQKMGSGMKSPTVMPLAESDDLVAVHVVLSKSEFWARYVDLKKLGATDLVASPAAAIIP